MAEYEPLTREERAEIVATLSKLPVASLVWTERDLLRYEETLRRCEERIAALEAPSGEGASWAT